MIVPPKPTVTTYWDWLVLSNRRYAKYLNREL